jgi:chromosome segregation ATPase
LSSHRKSLDESIQAAGDDQIKLGNQLVVQVTTLLESFRATSVEKEQFSNLREDKVRLEEQLKSSENVVQEIRGSRTSADTRESHLRNITDSLLNELKTLRSQPLADHKHRPQVDERDMISTWQMKYTTISQRLTDSEARLNRREKEIRQGEEDVEKLSGQLERVQAERDIAVQALSEAEDRRSADQSEIGKLQQTVCRIVLEIIVEKHFWAAGANAKRCR